MQPIISSSSDQVIQSSWFNCLAATHNQISKYKASYLFSQKLQQIHDIIW